MNAKQRVRLIYSRATHKRYETNGGYGYTLVWTRPFGEEKRLAEGKTTAEAWAKAWAQVKSKLPRQIQDLSPSKIDEWLKSYPRFITVNGDQEQYYTEDEIKSERGKNQDVVFHKDGWKISDSAGH